MRISTKVIIVIDFALILLIVVTFIMYQFLEIPIYSMIIENNTLSWLCFMCIVLVAFLTSYLAMLYIVMVHVDREKALIDANKRADNLIKDIEEYGQSFKELQESYNIKKENT